MEHFLGTRDTKKFAKATFQRQAVVVADLVDNAFYCRIELNTSNGGGKTAIVTFPCLSATFDPSDFSVLVANSLLTQSINIVVEARAAMV